MAHIKRVLSALCALLYAGLALCPAYLLALYMAEAEGVGMPLLYALGAAALAALIALLLGRRRLLPGLLALPLLLAGQYMLFPLPLLAAIALPLLTALYYLIVLNRAPLSIAEGYSAKVTVLGVLVHIAVFIVSFFMRHEPLSASLGLPAALFLVATALYINRAAVEHSVLLYNKQAPRSVVSGNMTLTAILAAVVLIIVNIGAITAFIADAAKALVSGVGWLIAKLMSLFESEGLMEDAGSLAAEQMIPEMGASEPSLLAKILDILFYVVGALVTIAALCGLAYLAYRAARKVAAWFRDSLARFRQSFSTDYTDEQTSLLDGESVLNNMLDGARDALKRAFTRPPRWNDMDNEQRVRYAYLRRRRALLKEGVDSNCLTPDQMLAKGYLDTGKADARAFAETYNDVRYGGLKATDAQASNARHML